MSAIIGREKEIKEIVELYNSDKSEFVACMGVAVSERRF